MGVVLILGIGAGVGNYHRLVGALRARHDGSASAKTSAAANERAAACRKSSLVRRTTAGRAGSAGGSVHGDDAPVLSASGRVVITFVPP